MCGETIELFLISPPTALLTNTDSHTDSGLMNTTHEFQIGTNNHASCIAQKSLKINSGTETVVKEACAIAVSLAKRKKRRV
jgi:hypothetical protein